jgi:putative glycosyltransferase (TIGR04348 family)
VSSRRWSIRIAAPAGAGASQGDPITAQRWARTLRDLGHKASVAPGYGGEACDLLVVLHAGRGAAAAERFAKEHPESPLVIALTGDDLYNEIHGARARHALEHASRIIVPQPLAVGELPGSLQARARVIYPSAEPPAKAASPRKGAFEVCVLGHLRPVKDPLRTAMASRLLPTESRIRILQVGGAAGEGIAERARTEEGENPRYRWMGELPRGKALQMLARSRLLVLSSLSGGGAQAIAEALAASVPILSSKTPGAIALLGPDYPGFFPVADTRALAALLGRAEGDPGFYVALRDASERAKPLIDPARERESWEVLLGELFAGE